MCHWAYLAKQQQQQQHQTKQTFINFNYETYLLIYVTHTPQIAKQIKRVITIIKSKRF